MQQATAAFPHLTNWQYTNEKDGESFGFTLWGEYVLQVQELLSRHFYITFATYEDTWSGHLTIGQHYYLWSSADMGDAHLLDTDACNTLAEAIAALQEAITSLCRMFSMRQ